jgi:hypothetical protein
MAIGSFSFMQAWQEAQLPCREIRRSLRTYPGVDLASDFRSLSYCGVEAIIRPW